MASCLAHPRSDTRVLSFKILLCGDARVGKTALVRSMVGDEFDYAARRPSCDIPSVFVSSKGESLHSIELVLWDVVGGGDSASVIPNAMRNVDVAVLLFDCVATPSEAGSVKRWMMRVKEVSPSAKFVTVATKQDLIIGGSGATVVDIIASRNGADADTLSLCLRKCVVLVSARTGSGVQELIAAIAEVLRERPQVEQERRNAARDIILAFDDAVATPNRATPQRAKGQQAHDGCIC